MAKKVKAVDPATRPQLVLSSSLYTDNYLMYLIQNVTKLPTSEILGFFADLSKSVAAEGVHFMHENGTSSMRKEIFDYFPGTVIPFSLKIEGNKEHGKIYNYEQKCWEYTPLPEGTKPGNYTANVGFPTQGSRVDQTKLADIIMEKHILGGSDMPLFEKPDTKCPKMYRELMAEVRSRRLNG